MIWYPGWLLGCWSVVVIGSQMVARVVVYQVMARLLVDGCYRVPGGC